MTESLVDKYSEDTDNCGQLALSWEKYSEVGEIQHLQLVLSAGCKKVALSIFMCLCRQALLATLF